MNCETDIRFLKGVGEKRAEILAAMGIDTVGALLRFYPRAYEDWSNIRLIDDCNVGERVCIKARIITDVSEQFIRKNMTLYKFLVQDESGTRMSVTLFNNRFLAEKLHNGSEYLFYGKMVGALFHSEMSTPEIREVGQMGIRPVYRSTAKFSSKNIEKLVKTAISIDLGDDPIPQEIRERNGLCELRTAIENIHFPRSEELLQRAKRRLVFEELFLLQTSLLLLKNKKRKLPGAILKYDGSAEFENKLPFGLTSAQNRVINECVSDMMSGVLMNRLVQGDVGSGKTAVAASLCYTAAKNGYQSALMAPTEILAEQHFMTLSSFFEGSELKCVLITGSQKKKAKDEAKKALADGSAVIAVGTHALLTDDVLFNNLGLVITDEQHRFGVAQRARLAAKGINPHTLVMSATPIPRTLGLILYGDLDISIIDEYPRGRQKIESYCVDSSYHKRVYKYIRKHLDEGRQGYIVCPLVEENEMLDIKSAEEYFEELRQDEFAKYSVGLLHGKMPPKQKDKVMRAFASGEIELLICTTVVEVGIDVPNSAIMVIENAERFGLSQLHQLRGRIGRGPYRSTCIFITDNKGDATKRRMEIMSQSSDGFEIADEDLRLRGPGDFLGSRQHGLPDFKIADLSDDMEVLRIAGNEARELLDRDPRLQDYQNKTLRLQIIDLYRKMNEN